MNQSKDLCASKEAKQQYCMAESEINSQQIYCSSQAQTQDNSNKLSKPSLQAPLAGESVKSKKAGGPDFNSQLSTFSQAKKKAARAQSTNAYGDSSTFSAAPNSTVTRIKYGVEIKQCGPPTGKVDSLQDEFDQILNKNNEKLNFSINQSINTQQKRAQSSTSNYFDHKQQVVRQNTEKKKKGKRQSKRNNQMQVNVTDIEASEALNNTTNQVRQNTTQDYGKLSIQQNTNINEPDLSDSKSAASANAGGTKEKKKRGSSAFSQFSKSIRSSISNIFSKSSKVQIAPVTNTLDQSNISNNATSQQDQQQTRGECNASSRKSKSSQQKPPKSKQQNDLSTRQAKHSQRYETNEDADSYTPYGLPMTSQTSVMQESYNLQQVKLNISSSKNIAPPFIGAFDTGSQQFIDKEEISRKMRETKAERKSRMLMPGHRSKLGEDKNGDTSEMQQLMIESGCYTNNGSLDNEFMQQLKHKSRPKRSIFSPQVEMGSPGSSQIIDSTDTKHIKNIKIVSRNSLSIRNKKVATNEDSENQIRQDSNQSVFFIENFAKTDEKLPRKLKLQRVKLPSKEKSRDPKKLVSPEYSERQSNIVGLSKDLVYGSIKSEISSNLISHDSNPNDISGIKINRDQNGKLKLKLGHNQKIDSREVILNSISRNQSKTSDQMKQLSHQQVETQARQGTNQLLQINQKKVMSTLEHKKRKPTLSHNHSALGNTIHVDNTQVPSGQLVKSNNYTRTSIQVTDTKRNANEMKTTPSMVMQSQAGNLVYLCSNHHIIPGHSEKEGVFYCSQDGQYLCESCIVEHRHHCGLDSVKNHLVNIFDDWCALLTHAQNTTQSLINTNMTKSREILLHLKRNCMEPPDLDVFKLRVIYQNLIKRLQKKINQIRDICKHNDLEKALRMHQDLVVFIYQFRELEDRSSITGMFSTYTRCNQNDDDLKLYQGLSNKRQYYLLRKQFDDRMRKLASISMMQRVRIQKYEHYIENQIEKKEALQVKQKQDFESQFDNIFQQKLEQIRCQKLMSEQFNLIKQSFGQSPQDNKMELLKSRDSIQISASVQDINEMIDSLNNNYSQPVVAQNNLNSRNDKENKGQVKGNNEHNNLAASGSATVAVNSRPKLKLNKTDKLDQKRASQPVFEMKIKEQTQHIANPSAPGITINNQQQQNHLKQPSLASQISDFNQSVRRNSNYESIMKSTRQKIIQSHMMQSAQKQKPYLMRLSTIFGDKSNDKSPMGIKADISNIDLGKALRSKQTMKHPKPPRCGGLSPLNDFKDFDKNGLSPQVYLDSQISSFQGTLRNMGYNDFPNTSHQVNGMSNKQSLEKSFPLVTPPEFSDEIQIGQNLDSATESQGTTKVALLKTSLQQKNNSSSILSPTKGSEFVPQTDMIQTIRLEKTDVRNDEDLIDTPLFSQQLQQEIVDTFNAKILSDERPLEKMLAINKQSIVADSVVDYEDLCNLNESILKRLHTAQLNKDVTTNNKTNSSSLSSIKPRTQHKGIIDEKNNKMSNKQTRNHNRELEICSRFNIWPRNLNISKSSRMVDWSDKLKHMEIKDVMDIDINNMTEEFSSFTPNHDNKRDTNKSSLADDSFTQYLEKLKQEDDQLQERNELNYNLDQLGSYQSCYIDNKTPMKNRGPVPEDLISHLDYLDEGVLIMQPDGNEDNKQIQIIEKKTNGQKHDLQLTAPRGVGGSSVLINQLEIVRQSRQRTKNGSAIETSPFTRLLNQHKSSAEMPSNVRKENLNRFRGDGEHLLQD